MFVAFVSSSLLLSNCLLSDFVVPVQLLHPNVFLLLLFYEFPVANMFCFVIVQTHPFVAICIDLEKR